jgi:hypothetical protein
MTTGKAKDAAGILAQNSEIYARKNQDYGSSWKLIGELIWKLGGEEPIVLNGPRDVIAFGLFTRRFDKIARSFHGEFRSETLNFESAADSDEDESVYASMQAENKYDREREQELESRLAEGYRALAEQDDEYLEPFMTDADFESVRRRFRPGRLVSILLGDR